MRIQKILSAHGVASRRKAEALILEGRVTVNGLKAELGRELVYIMLNKPRGYVTTMSDERGRKTVMSLLTDLDARVFPVGRLDINSEGLLLLTNDGLFANTVAHPSFNKAKTYEVRVRGDAAGAVGPLGRPMELDFHMILAEGVTLAKRTADGGILRITISEGRNRQIRKMCANCGLDVVSLKRVSIGSLALGELRTGKWRHLTKEELRNMTFSNHPPSADGTIFAKEGRGWKR
jgi:23S rRNA pseudouridine2605 synthase